MFPHPAVSRLPNGSVTLSLAYRRERRDNYGRRTFRPLDRRRKTVNTTALDGVIVVRSLSVTSILALPPCRDTRHRSLARAEVTPLEKVLLIGCARLWAATATSGTRGACVVSADQAPRRARSMGARGSGIFNGVTQSASLLAFQRPHKRHSWHFNVTLGISEPLARHSLRLGCCGLPVICS